MQPKLVILEGPDGAGKTTLSLTLAKAIGARVIRHDSQPGRETMFSYFLHSLRQAWTAQQPVIFDRSWASEPIYGHVLRNGADRVGAHARALHRVALGMGAVDVMCLPPYEVVLENFRATRDQQLPEREDQMRQIYTMYASIVKEPSERILVYDYTRDKLEALVTKIISQAGLLSNPGPGIGNWRPGKVVLMVGEQPGERDEYDVRRYNWPFVSDRGCSGWLSEQLQMIHHLDASVMEESLYWINAVKSDGKKTSPAFIETLKPIRVVAMGEKARAWCLQHGVPHYHISHPQYWKRFHSKQPWFELWYALGASSAYKYKYAPRYEVKI